MMRNPAWKTQNGGGCLGCPVDPCLTLTYRGSTCAAQRAKLGLGDPLTHADCIRAMSDEEMAAWINDCNTVCATCAHDGECVEPYDREKCIGGIKKWLQQPVKEEPT